MVNRAKFTVNGEASVDPISGDRLYSATNSELLSLTLETNPSDCISVMYEVYSSSDEGTPESSKNAPELTFEASGEYKEVILDPNGTAQIRMPSSGVVSYNIRCTAAYDQGSDVYERQVAVLSIHTPPLKKTVPAETNEGLARGFSDVVDDIIDALEALVVGSGVASLAADGESGMSGILTLSGSDYIDLTQTVGDIAIAVDVTSLNSVLVHNSLDGLNAGDYRHLTAVQYTDLTDGGTTTLHTHAGLGGGVTSFSEFGQTPLTGAVTVSESSHITLSQASQNVSIAVDATSLNSVLVHNSLDGLNAGDYRHLTAVQYTDLTDGGTTALHTHAGIGVSSVASITGDVTVSEGSFIDITIASQNIDIDVDVTGLNSVLIHNSLDGLNAGDYRHLTAVQYTDLTDGGTTTLHTHAGLGGGVTSFSEFGQTPLTGAVTVSESSHITLSQASQNVSIAVDATSLNSVLVHNSLDGLNAGDYRHLTAAHLTGLTTGVSTSLHLHPYTGILDTPAGRIPFGTGTGTGLSSDSALLWDSTNDRLTSRRIVLSTNPGALGTLYGCHVAAYGSGAASFDARFVADHYTSDPGSYPSLDLRLSGTATLGSHARPANSAVLGRCGFWGSNGSAFYRAASITASITENWASGEYGTELTLSTTPNEESSTISNLRLAEGHAYIYNSLIAGQGHTFTGDHGAVFGANNTNAMDYATVSGQYAKAEWNHGHYQTGFRLDGSTVGGSQSFGPITIGRRFTSGINQLLTQEAGGESPTIYTTFELEQGYAYVFEVLLSSSFVGSSYTGWDRNTYLITAYRDATTGDVGGVGVVTTGPTLTTVTGVLEASADNAGGRHGIDIRWDPPSLCTASDPIDVVARVVGVKHRTENND